MAENYNYTAHGKKELMADSLVRFQDNKNNTWELWQSASIHPYSNVKHQ
jgi:hypothetical protein